MIIKVQKEDFDFNKEMQIFKNNNKKIGAIASFIGLVRDLNEGDEVGKMNLEHYPGMTEKSLNKIAENAKNKWRVFDVLIIHRIGELYPGDQIVLVMVSSSHRGDSFEACQYIMDFLKTKAPLWK